MSCPIEIINKILYEMSLPIEIINNILYYFNGLEHPISNMIKKQIHNINQDLINEKSFCDLNEFYDIDEQIEYLSGCEEYTNFNINYGSISLWKICIYNYNNNNNSKFTYNIDSEYEEDNGFLRINYIKEQDDKYEEMGFSNA